MNGHYYHWLFNGIKLPQGSKLVAESDYKTTFKGVNLIRRNLHVDLTFCKERSMENMDFKGENSRPGQIMIGLKYFFLDQLEKVISSGFSECGINDASDCYFIYGPEISGVMNFKQAVAEKAIWEIDFVFSYKGEKIEM